MPLYGLSERMTCRSALQWRSTLAETWVRGYGSRRASLNDQDSALMHSTSPD